jgi:hypothetical protein
VQCAPKCVELGSSAPARGPLSSGAPVLPPRPVSATPLANRYLPSSALLPPRTRRRALYTMARSRRTTRRARRIRCDDVSPRRATLPCRAPRHQPHTCITAPASVMRAARREALRFAALRGAPSASQPPHALLTGSLALMLHTAGIAPRGGSAAGHGRCSRPHTAPHSLAARSAGWAYRHEALLSASTRRGVAAVASGADGPAAQSAAVTWGAAPSEHGPWAATSRWVVFSDLHVSARSLDVCLAVLDKVRGQALGAVRLRRGPLRPGAA